MSDGLAYTLEAKIVPWGPYVPPKAKVERTIVMRNEQPQYQLG